MRAITTKIIGFLSGMSRNGILLIVLLTVFLFGILDYVSGFEIAFSFFYLIPIAIATWYLGKREGRVIVAISILIWAISNFRAGEHYSHEIIRYWNIGIRMVVFFMFAELLYELQQALLLEKAQSRTDHLTGISNRRELYDRAELEIERVRRTGQPLTVAFMDLDAFKQVNDMYGHEEGDKLLKVISKTASSIIRRTDTFARLGGDEFVFLFPNTNSIFARQALEKIKVSIASTIFETGKQVTFSIGVVTFQSPPRSVEELLMEADRFAYKVKENGKNNIAYLTIGEKASEDVPSSNRKE